MSAKQIAEFEETLECNLASTAPEIGHFRINIYRQRGDIAMVARRINHQIPGFEALGLPPAVQELILTMEDPIEYLFSHHRCTVDQREVGIDTVSFSRLCC